MPFAEKIVHAVNEKLKASSLNGKVFQSGRIVGLASQAGRKKSDGSTEVLPVTKTLEGAFDFVLPDDRYPFVLYHRILSNTYAFAKVGYGDGQVVEATTEVQLVCWFDGAKVSADMEAVIVFGLPQGLPRTQLVDLGLSACTITPVSSNQDTLQVFRQEYQGSDYFLKPSHHLFAVRYRIKTQFDRSCVQTCGCTQEQEP